MHILPALDVPISAIYRIVTSLTAELQNYELDYLFINFPDIQTCFVRKNYSPSKGPAPNSEISKFENAVSGFKEELKLASSPTMCQGVHSLYTVNLQVGSAKF